MAPAKRNGDQFVCMCTMCNMCVNFHLFWCEIRNSIPCAIFVCKMYIRYYRPQVKEASIKRLTMGMFFDSLDLIILNDWWWQINGDE
jgi:hypothetical protein